MFSRDERHVFDDAAEVYDAARPGYPEELVAELIAQAGLMEASRILEIGPGTGQLTRQLAQHPFEITAIELGARLARIAATRFAANPRVQVINAAFEDWEIANDTFDLIVSAQALHWIDPTVGFAKIHQALRPSGSLAVVYNLCREGANQVHKAVDAAYQQHFPRAPGPGHRRTLNDRVEEILKGIRASGLFSEPALWQCPWAERYTTQRYLKLLDTFSDHRTLEMSTRERLYGAIRDAIDAHGGQIERPLVATLLVSNPL